MQSIHKVHKKANGGDVGAAHSIDYASREMTMIKALQEKRLATMGEDGEI